MEEAKTPEEEEKKEDVKKAEEKKEEKKEEVPAPPPPPPEIVLKVFMHCEGCARKVRKCLRGFEGVEYVTTDYKSDKVVVKGEKADPVKVLERLQKKSHKQVELISPIPKPPAEEEKKPEEKAPPKPEEKKEEPPPVITVVLKIYMHCEACAHEIKKRIMRMKGVESAEPDLKSSEVTVKGVFEAVKLVDYIHKRTGKKAVIVKQDPPEKKEEEKPKDADQKKAEESVDKEKKDEKEKKEGEGGGDDAKKAAEAAASAATGAEEAKVVEVKRNEFYYYPPRYAVEYAYPPAPQIFSDENPNACSVV